MFLVLVVIIMITVSYSVQVKKAVGGSIRGMALYEDDVSYGFQTILVTVTLIFLLHEKENPLTMS